jgi:hypothetical protein
MVWVWIWIWLVVRVLRVFDVAVSGRRLGLDFSGLE